MGGARESQTELILSKRHPKHLMRNNRTSQVIILSESEHLRSITERRPSAMKSQRRPVDPEDAGSARSL
jgi:hypothetical protein